MSNLFKKSKLAMALVMQSLVLAGATAASCVAWFSSTDANISTTIPSSVITSYFYTGTGTEADPYVITKPVHYYNLVNLWENNWSGFDVNNGEPYIQFGYKFDNTNYQFETYSDTGVLTADTYTTSLNMNYYSGAHALAPIGSGTQPFTGHIVGNGLTVENLYIKGNGRCDIGIFGYVTAAASIDWIYFSDVYIDCSTPDLNDTTETHEGTHPYHSYIGYLAGHTVDANCWTNVYVNNCRLLNTSEATVQKKDNYGYFGCVGLYEATPPSTNIDYSTKLRASDVYNYFNTSDHYGVIDGKGLATRNTEYTAGDTDTFATAVSNANSTYTFAGDDASGTSAKDYSLATAGYQSESVTYDLTYGTNHLSLNTATQETTTSPEDMATAETAGYYMYWDATDNQWVYYITQMSQGGQVETEYNCYFISFDVINDQTQAIDHTYYIGVSNDAYVYTEFSTPPTVADNPGYCWVLKDNASSVGISSLTSNGGNRAVHWYNPSSEKYFYVATGGTASSPSRPALVDTYAGGTEFTIEGPDSAANYNSNVEQLIYNSGLGGGVASSIYKKVTMHFTGGVVNNVEDDSAKTYNLITDLANIEADSVYVLGYTDLSAVTKIMSASQNTNNRAANENSTYLNYTTHVLSHASDMGEFRLSGDSTGWSFQDIKNGGYLCTPDTSGNHLRLQATINNYSKYTIAVGTASTYQMEVTNVQYPSKFMQYNTREGTNGYIFSSYSSTSGSCEDLHFFERDENSVGYIKTSGAFQASYTTGAAEDQYISLAYDTYRSLPGTTEYTLFTIARANVTSLVFDFPNSQVTITWPDEQDGGWFLVTDATTLAAGDKIVVAASGYNYAMSATQNSNNRGQAAITKADDTISFTSSSGVCEFTLGGATGAWTFYDTNASGFLYAASSSSNYLRTQTTNDANGQWSISITSNVATVTSQGTNTNNLMKYNNTSFLFSCYASGQKDISLYRYQEAQEYDGIPIYIGDHISTDYDPNYLDVVGATTYDSDSFNLTNYYSSILSMSYYSALLDQGIGSQFYNTYYTSNAIVVKVMNTGLLDLGTLDIKFTGNGTPMLTKGANTVGGSGTGLNVAGTTGWRCPDLDASATGYEYSLSFSPHNILKACYCTLDSAGNIYSSHDTSGNMVLCQDTTFDITKVDSYIVVLTNSSSTNMDVSEVSFSFKDIPGNTGDFGTVGYRSATYTDGANSNSASTKVTGTVLNLYFTIDSESSQQVYCKVNYDLTTTTYTITFYSTVACELNVFNYDTVTYDVYVNGTQYYGGSNVISISATTYDSATWI